MEMIIFMGAQATGKSSFYQSRFFNTHLRINLDMLRTRNRERLLFDACLLARQPMVLDNMNPTRLDRARYIVPARQIASRLTGYYFQSVASECIRRNTSRERAWRVPDIAIRGTINRLQLPSKREGFDKIYFVRIEKREFVVEDWIDEV